MSTESEKKNIKQITTYKNRPVVMSFVRSSCANKPHSLSFVEQRDMKYLRRMFKLLFIYCSDFVKSIFFITSISFEIS